MQVALLREEVLILIGSYADQLSRDVRDELENSPTRPRALNYADCAVTRMSVLTTALYQTEDRAQLTGDAPQGGNDLVNRPKAT